MLHGVRGATTVAANEAPLILAAVVELLTAIVKENAIKLEDIGAVIFSSTPDLNAAFPAAAARKIGWSEVPLFGTQEIEQPDGLPFCIRALILWNTDTGQSQIKHVYLHDAIALRLDIQQK